MSAEDAMHALCEQLTSFHISARLQRLAMRNIFINATNLTSTSQAAMSQNPPSAIQPSITITTVGLPPPQKGRRPCWEPPVLSYSWFEQILEASKDVQMKDANIDIEARTMIIDHMIEDELLGRYHDWILDKEYEARFQTEESGFWVDMVKEVRVDMDELALENNVMMRESKGKVSEWRGFRARLVFLARKKDRSIGHPRMDEVEYDDIDRSLGISKLKRGSTVQRDIRLLLGEGQISIPTKTSIGRTEAGYRANQDDQGAQALRVVEAEFQGLRDRLALGVAKSKDE